MTDGGGELVGDLLDAVGCGLVIVERATGTVAYANRRAGALLDQASPALIGRPLWDVVRPDGAEGRTPAGGVLRWSPEPGRRLRAEIVPTADDGHRHVLLLDETTETERDEELRFLRRAVDRLDSLALAEHAAAAVSHDLNNVLQSVVGLTQLALEDPSHETLSALSETASHASRLSRLLLETGRPRPDGSPYCDPVTALQRIEPVLECLLRRRLRLELAETGPVALPRPALERIVINLAANARDATVAGGTVSIRTRADRDEAVLEVEDTGAGMDADTLARAMDLAFTTKPDGTGLGLALVHRIVRRYDGTLQLESEPRHGTRATVRLPRAII